MPKIRGATLRAADLPDVITIAELAEFDRVDKRTLRADVEAGRVPGAYRRGTTWRILKVVYLASLGIEARSEAPEAHLDE